LSGAFGHVVSLFLGLWRDRKVRFCLYGFTFVFFVAIISINTLGVVHAAPVDPICPDAKTSISPDRKACTSKPECASGFSLHSIRICNDGSRPTCPGGAQVINNYEGCSDVTPICAKGKFEVHKIQINGSSVDQGWCVGNDPYCVDYLMQLTDSNRLCVKDPGCPPGAELAISKGGDKLGYCIISNLTPKTDKDCPAGTIYHQAGFLGRSYCETSLSCAAGSILDTEKVRCQAASVCQSGAFAPLPLELHDGFCLVSNGASSGGPGSGNEAACSTGPGLAGAVAWIICPFAQLAADVSVWLQNNFIKPYLTVSPLTTEDGPNGPPVVYTLWKNFRDLANVMLVIAFFAVIFSQATAIGISNYGIKKILPRLVLVAIGSNLSFFIIAFIIDAFNVFGGGVDSLTVSVVNSAIGTGNTYYPSGAHSIFVLVLPTVAALIIKAGPVLQFLVGILGLILLMLFVSVIALIIRQMLIIMLVVVAAPAIVLFLLPNTEQYYKKWQKWLLELLIMYPVIILFLAAGKIVGVILASNVDVGGG
jgi:hypothetical protein